MNKKFVQFGVEEAGFLGFIMSEWGIYVNRWMFGGLFGKFVRFLPVEMWKTFVRGRKNVEKRSCFFVRINLNLNQWT